jgi:hypothetical protein
MHGRGLPRRVNVPHRRPSPAPSPPSASLRFPTARPRGVGTPSVESSMACSSACTAEIDRPIPIRTSAQHHQRLSPTPVCQTRASHPLGLQAHLRRARVRQTLFLMYGAPGRGAGLNAPSRAAGGSAWRSATSLSCHVAECYIGRVIRCAGPPLESGRPLSRRCRSRTLQRRRARARALLRRQLQGA